MKQETKNKLSKIKKEFYKEDPKRREREITWGNGYFKSGVYKGIFCQSTYELAFVVYLEILGLTPTRCKLWIPYTFEDEERRYNPDFEVQEHIYEIKGRFTPQDNAKIRDAHKYGIKLLVLNKKYIMNCIDIINKYFDIDFKKQYHLFYNEEKLWKI